MTSSSDISAPMGGPARSGERILLGQVSMAHLVSHVHITTVPALMPLLPAFFGASYVEIGLALTVFNLVSLLVQTPMGFATDRFGARRILLLGLVLGGSSFLSIAVSPSYVWLLIAMAAAGLANGVYHPADYALLARGIDGSRMGRAFSIHTFAGYFGNAIAPPLLLGAAALAGVGQAFALAGVLAFVVAVLIILTPVGEGGARSTAARQADGPQEALPRASLITPTVISLIGLFVLLALSTGGLVSYAVAAFVQGYGLDLASASAALTAFLFASALGVLAGGALADRTRRHGLVAAAAYLATAVITAGLALTTPSAVVVIILMGLAGFLSGIITPSRDMMVRAAAPRGAEGIVFGIVSTGFNIGGLIGPLLFAFLLDRGQPRAIFAVAAVFMVLTVLLALVQERRRT
ncbi:MFS transporter [Phreatobacter sp.]|uniref:MFS transporter n=1 Tax=Phreatobacter sp. TaxID=1966341 RepID=UPI003F70488C